jgi:hypothetical protein
VCFPFKFLSSKWILKTTFLLSGAMLRTVVGEVCFFLFPLNLILVNLIQITFNFIQPTGTSTKFVNMTERALQHFEHEHGIKLKNRQKGGKVCS